LLLLFHHFIRGDDAYFATLFTSPSCCCTIGVQWLDPDRLFGLLWSDAVPGDVPGIGNAPKSNSTFT